jgi:hypothetical protein
MKNTPKGKRGNIGFDPTCMYSPTRVSKMLYAVFIKLHVIPISSFKLGFPRGC